MAKTTTDWYDMQPAFTGGEISPDVASRVDLDKYQRALLQAENAIVRPYGAVRKRPGMIYMGEAKYAAKKAILYKFDFSVETSYLLEIGHEYIRIWKNGSYLGIEITTPFEESELDSLRFVQSIDVLYICSGTHPVKKLMRYTEDNWQLVDIDWKLPPFGSINEDEDLTITPSATTGTVTLTASKSYFTSDMVGAWLKLSQYMPNSTVSSSVTSSWTSDSLLVQDGWKIVTHGTWNGTVEVQVSQDNGTTWMQERKYTGNSDFNPSESGTVDDLCLMRVVATITSGTCSVDFSSTAYTFDGYVKITAVTSETAATADVQKDRLGSTDATDEFYLAAWNERDGYPNCVTFFQDRLCFGGSTTYPQRVWMSKSGDYENFGVDKEDGSVTDDSAVTANLLSSKTYNITHMTAGNDLLVLTDGNEWSISGNETVSPSSITPRNQQNNGTNDVLPIRINNRTIYVQRRGSIVRDIAYNYDSDSYVGADLTLLAKHLIRDKQLTGGCYQQEPDSMVYLVRGDGAILCLAYIAEQNVYAWSRIITDGKVEAMASCQQGNNDVVYAIVNRTINGETKRYIERFDKDHDSDSQQDYVMLDSAVHYQLSEAVTEITGLSHLEGKTVDVLADGYLWEGKTVSNGTVTIAEAAKDIIVGMPYTMILETPNFNITLKSSGTMQGRQKAISFCILRLMQSYGGSVGPDADHLNTIVYETGRMEQGGNVLYSGDKRATMSSGGFNTDGRVYIKHDKPYPFTLGAVIRVVTIGG